MSQLLSANTQAILLLTAPLLAGRGEASTESLTPGEYKKLARHLHSMEREPADLLAPESTTLLKACRMVIDDDRLQRLLARGFLLSQAVDRWQSRAIWVVSRADANYPRRLRERLKEDAPPIVYGCGDAAILDMGGLAVVGSRNVDEGLIEYAQNIGRLAAGARQALVSGGARGIDQAAMRGALEWGGKAIGVLADSLENTAMNRDHRNMLMEGHLVLISPYDPSAGFNVGHAMQRNKLIYALADVALVVSSDYQKGGTWAGAVEQLEKFKFVPIYIRATGETSDGLAALEKKGALPWPNPTDPDVFMDVFASAAEHDKNRAGQKGDLFATEPSAPIAEPRPIEGDAPMVFLVLADELFVKVRELLQRMLEPKTDREVAAELNVSKSQAKQWLQRLVDEGVLEKCGKPVRYRTTPAKQAGMFEPLEPSQEGEMGTRH